MDKDIVSELRSDLQQQAAQPYTRPQVPQDLGLALTRAAGRLAAVRDNRQRWAFFQAIMVENARLLAECNQHRAALGYELLPEIDPLTGTIKK